MRSNILALALTFSASAYAVTQPSDFRMQCTTSVSGLSLAADGNRMRLHLEDSAGFKDFPIFSGIVTPYMLPLVNRGAKDLASINGVLDVTWDLAKCKVDPKRPFLISCGGIGTLETPKTKTLLATSLSTSTNDIDSLDVQAQTINVNLGISTTDKAFRHYFINLPFDSQHCELAEPSQNQTSENKQ